MTLILFDKINNRKMRLGILFLYLLMICGPLQAANADAFKITQKDNNNYRLSLNVDQADSFQARIESNPNRLIILLPQNNFDNESLPKTNYPFKTMSAQRLEGQGTHLTLEFVTPFIIDKAFIFPEGRLNINLKRADDAAFQENLFIKHGPFQDNDEKETLVFNQTRKPIIVIDPGHGGRDPGAVSASGIFEKDITLTLSKKIIEVLNATGQYDARLTRINDKFISLSNRVNIARENKADLFISIHADSIRGSSISGASIYTLSNKPSDIHAAKMAARENNIITVDNNVSDLGDAGIHNFLIDLAMSKTIQKSQSIADLVVLELQSQGIDMINPPHRSANFVVLRAPEIPSILIETGYISNEQEAQILLSSERQNQIANAILQSLHDYFGFN
jgi:N-acetylmuramoyl-L-alanine amidase